MPQLYRWVDDDQKEKLNDLFKEICYIISGKSYSKYFAYSY